MATEVEITTVFEPDKDGYYIAARLPGATQPFEGRLPGERVSYADGTGDLEVRGVRYGYPGPGIWLTVRPIGGAKVPAEGLRIRWQ